MVQDKLADDFLSFSPYAYAVNNPVMFIDPDGNAPTRPIPNAVQVLSTHGILKHAGRGGEDLLRYNVTTNKSSERVTGTKVTRDYHPNKAVDFISQAMGAPSLRKVENVEVTSNEVDFSYDEKIGMITISQTIKSVSVDLIGGEIPSNIEITGHTHVNRYIARVDSDGNVSFNFGESVSSSVEYINESSEYADLPDNVKSEIKRAMGFNGKVERNAQQFRPSVGSTPEEMWNYTKQSEETINRVHP